MRRTKLIEFRGNRTQTEMAEKYGVTQQAWSMWERGKNIPNLPTMKKLETDTGIPMENIFADAFTTGADNYA